MTSNSQLRALSRNQLENRIFSTNWLLMLLVCLIVFSLPTSVSVKMPTGDAVGNFSVQVSTGGIIGFVLYGWLQVGFAAVALILIRAGGRVDLKYLIQGFKKGFVLRSFLIGLMEQIFVVLWSILLIIPGIVKKYAYFASYYISLDQPELSAKQCLDESQRLMKGHKMRLFLLDLSFIGWYIVGFVCLGVGILFVQPYHQLARANFYDKLVNG